MASTGAASAALQLVPLEALTLAQRREAARILHRALIHAPSAWPTLEAAGAEVATFFEDPDRIGMAIALVEGGAVCGWIGAIRAYDGHAWELHPLVVDPPRQRRGLGARLVRALEDRAAAAGVSTLYLGTDDDFGGTSLHGRDLYPDPLKPLSAIEATGGHPFAFYRKLGFAVVGVIPDANGPGRPDILMAKRVGA